MLRNLIFVIALVTAPALSLAQELQNSLLGVFTEAPNSTKLIGSQITFVGLSGQEARMVWPDGYDTKLYKIFENPNLVVLQSVGAVGSTDTVYIERKNKRFLVVSVGAMEIVVNGKPVAVSLYRGNIK